MTDLAAVNAVVHGRVQGVFFRAFVSQRATALGLTGFARNMPRGTVEVDAEGEKAKLIELINHLKIGPPASRVERVETTWSEYNGRFSVFEIRY